MRASPCQGWRPLERAAVSPRLRHMGWQTGMTLLSYRFMGNNFLGHNDL